MQPFPGDVATVERADLDRHFTGWMAEAGGKIRKMPVAERKEMRDELYGYAVDIARELGDVRGAQLLQMMPQSAIYGMALEGDVLTRGKVDLPLRPGAAERLRAEIVAGARAIGLSGEGIARRLETGAANAWEERDWVCRDLMVIAGRRRLDLRDPDLGKRVAGVVQEFHDRAARAIELTAVHESVPDNARLVRTLRSMGQIMQAEGRVTFRGEADAARFTTELHRQYGTGIVTALAAGRTDALAGDVEDPTERQWIARALLSAARSHVAFGLTLKEIGQAEQRLAAPAPRKEQDWER